MKTRSNLSSRARRGLAPFSAALVACSLAACGDVEDPTPMADVGVDIGDVGDAGGDVGADVQIDAMPGDTGADATDAGGDAGDTSADADDTADTNEDATALPEITATEARILASSLELAEDDSGTTEVVVAVAADGYPGPIVATITTPDAASVEVTMNLPSLQTIVLETPGDDSDIYTWPTDEITFTLGDVSIPLTGWNTVVEVDNVTFIIERYQNAIEVTLVGAPAALDAFVGSIATGSKSVDGAMMVREGGERVSMAQSDEYLIYQGPIAGVSSEDSGAEILSEFKEVGAAFDAESAVDREPLEACEGCAGGQLTDIRSTNEGIVASFETRRPAVWFRPSSTRLQARVSVDGGEATTTSLRGHSVLDERVLEAAGTGAPDAAVEVTLYDRVGTALGTVTGQADEGTLTLALTSADMPGMPASAFERTNLLFVTIAKDDAGEDVVSVAVSGRAAEHVGDGWISLDGIGFRTAFARDYGSMLIPDTDVPPGAVVDIALIDSEEGATVDRVVQTTGEDGIIARYHRPKRTRLKVRRSTRMVYTAPPEPATPPTSATPVVAAGFEREGDGAVVWAIVRGEGPAGGLQATITVDGLEPSTPVALDVPMVADVIYAFERPADWSVGARTAGEIAIEGLGSATFVDGDFAADIDPGLDDIDWSVDARSEGLIEFTVRGDFELMAAAGLVPSAEATVTPATLDGTYAVETVTQRIYTTEIADVEVALDGGSEATVAISAVGLETALAESSAPWSANQPATSLWIDEDNVQLTVFTDTGVSVDGPEVELLLADGESVFVSDALVATGEERVFESSFLAGDSDGFEVSIAIEREGMSPIEASLTLERDTGWVEITDTETEQRFIRIDTDADQPGYANVRVSSFRIDGQLLDTQVLVTVRKEEATLLDERLLATENATIFDMESMPLDDVIGWRVVVKTNEPGDRSEQYEFEGVATSGPFEQVGGGLGFGQVIARTEGNGKGTRKGLSWSLFNQHIALL